MKAYAVIDTNVLVSALLSANDDAATVQVLDRFLNGDVTLVYSDEIIAEYSEVLRRRKFRFPEETVNYMLLSILHFGLRVDPAKTNAVLPDMKDLPFYEVVMEKQDKGAYLVTGNLKHFPKEPFIVTARQFIDIMDGKASPDRT